MNIAIDNSPLEEGHFLQHRVRGTGFYLNNLKESLQKYFPEHKYIFFTRSNKLPKNVDLIHYPYFEPFFITLPLTSSKKTVITVHDLTPLVFPKSFPRGLKGEIKWLIQKRSLKKADGIITDSNSSKKDICKYVGIEPSKVKVIYLSSGPDFKKVSKAEMVRKKYKLPEKFALYVGDVTWNKNLPRVVQAIKRTDVKLVLVGKALLEKADSNPWNQDLNIVQRFTDEDNQFIRLGFVPTNDLVSIYNLATVFVMPSLYEGFGLPILEAMNCGCPVITSNEGSIPEVAEKAAYYVDAYDIEKIKEGILEVFGNDNLREALSKKGLLQASKFSWKKTAEETLKVYEEILEEQ